MTVETCWRANHGLPPCEGAIVKPLTLKDVRQRADYDCGAACLEVVASFHGLRLPRMELANAVQGMAPDTIEAVLRSLGLRVLSGTMDAADLRHFTQQRRPVLCPITLDGCGHWVVVAGVAWRKVHFHDPLRGASSLSLAEWESGWRDTSRPGHEYDRWGICGMA